MRFMLRKDLLIIGKEMISMQDKLDNYYKRMLRSMKRYKFLLKNRDNKDVPMEEFDYMLSKYFLLENIVKELKIILVENYGKGYVEQLEN